MDLAGLDAAMGDAERAFIDTSVCIAFHSPVEVVHPLARHLMRRIERADDPLSGYLSVVSAAELLVRPIRGASADLLTMHAFLRNLPNLHIIDVDFEVAHQAARIRALRRVALPDALIVATAILSGCEAIVTNDAQWSRRLGPLFPQFTWIHLGR
jgi:predicted nucleic acid-binding protein